MKYKLVIWDFDGVIADSEKIYLENRQLFINNFFGLNWDFDTIVDYFGGKSDLSNRKILDGLGYITDDEFWNNIFKLDLEKMSNGGLKPIKNVENVIKTISNQCVATGGIYSKTKVKLEFINFWNKYFDDNNLFTADMVKNGKPEPDIFLLAANKMGEKPENCIVIEDSIAGITAAKKAGMDVIAFLGCEMYHNNQYLDKVKKCDAKYICYSMEDVEAILMR